MSTSAFKPQQPTLKGFLYRRSLVLLAVYITANISGGHLNPAVTVATVFTGHLKILVGLGYVIAQITGAIFGTLVLVSS